MKPLSPSSSAGPAPSCSPQPNPSDPQEILSFSRERESGYYSSHGHRSRHASWSELRTHGRHKDRSHRHNKEKPKSIEQLQHATTLECSPMHSPQSWSGQSSAVSICSISPGSPSCDSDYSPSPKTKRRRTKERISRSPDLDLFIGSHHPHESKCHRKRRKRSVSSSSADSHSEKSCLDKPSGKRKYKTRHLERAAQRQHEEGNTSKEKQSKRHSRDRSPSVEIIYERRAPDPHWVQRKKKKKKHRKRRKDLDSPTVITIDSDSDRTIDCLDRVMDVTDQTAADIEQRDGTSEQAETCTLASSNLFSESSSPVRPSDPTNEHSLNLDDCVVDVVDQSSSDCSHNIDSSNREEFVPDPFPMSSITTAPSSDTRLLESILQDLEEFLPAEEPEIGPSASSPLQQDHTSSPPKELSNTRDVDNSENKTTGGDEPQEMVTNTAS